MHAMTKETFKLCVHADTGTQYLALAVDEKTKNHGPNDKKMSGAKMPEMPGNPLCPVISYVKYQQKLNPKWARLWQGSKVSFTDDEEIWYTNSPLGEKTLSKFMSELSSKVGLSMRYTNHSVRATGATILSKGGFNPAQIMSVTGHKSVSSLTVYQRVSDEEGISMGQTINDHIHNNNQQLIPLPVPPANTLPVPSIRTIANEPFDIELEDMSLEDFQNQDGQESHVRLGLPSAMTTHTHNVQQPALSSIFSNCRINKVTIVTQQKL